MDNELYHHGIKGQKWGVRRFQNPDGSLTEAGKSRYYDVASSYDARYNYASEKYARKMEKRAEKWQKKADEAKADKDLEWAGSQEYAKKAQKKADRYKLKAEAQQKANEDRLKLDSKMKTSKQVVQNILYGSLGGTAYRNAIARGATKGRARAEAILAGTITGTLLRKSGEKKAYGTTVHSGI